MMISTARSREVVPTEEADLPVLQEVAMSRSTEDDCCSLRRMFASADIKGEGEKSSLHIFQVLTRGERYYSMKSNAQMKIMHNQ
jgi:hypothetical protein